MSFSLDQTQNYYQCTVLEGESYSRYVSGTHFSKHVQRLNTFYRVHAWITLIYTLSVDRRNYSNRLRKGMTWRASVRAENIFDDTSSGLLRSNEVKRQSRTGRQTSNVLLGVPAGVQPGEVTGV